MNKIIQYLIYIIILIILFFGLYFFNIALIPNFLAPLRNYFDTKNSQKEFDKNAKNSAKEDGTKYEKVETVFDKFKQSIFGKIMLMIIVAILIYKFAQFITYAGFPILGATYLSIGSSYLTPSLNKRLFINSQISKNDMQNFNNLEFYNELIQSEIQPNEIVSSTIGKFLITICKIFQSTLSSLWLFSLGWFGTTAISFQNNQDLLLLDKLVYENKYLESNPMGWGRRFWKFILWFTTLGLDKSLFEQIRPYENTLMSWKKKSFGLFKYWFYIFLFMLGINKLPLATISNFDDTTIIFGSLNTIFYITLIIILSILFYKQVRSIWLPGKSTVINLNELNELNEQKQTQEEEQKVSQTGGADEEVIYEEEIEYGKNTSIKSDIIKNVFEYEQIDCEKSRPKLIEEIINLNEKQINYSCDPNNVFYNFNNVIRSYIPENKEQIFENTTFDQKLNQTNQNQFNEIYEKIISQQNSPVESYTQEPIEQKLTTPVSTALTPDTSVPASSPPTSSPLSSTQETSLESDEEINPAPAPTPAPALALSTPVSATPVSATPVSATTIKEDISVPVSSASVTSPISSVQETSLESVDNVNPSTTQQTGGNIDDFDVKKTKKMKIPKIENFEHIFYDKNGDPIYVDAEGFLHKITDFKIQNKKKKITLN